MPHTRRPVLLGALVLLLIVVVGLYWVRHNDFASADLPLLLPADTTSITRIELARELDTLCVLRDESGAWHVQGITGSPQQTVHSLFEFLSAIRIEFPVPLKSGDTVVDYARDAGIQVVMTQVTGPVLRYTLAPWPGGHILLYAPDKDRAYVASAVGYSPSLLQSLSLRPDSWVIAKLGVGLPSDIRSVELRWLDDSDPGFRLIIDSALQAVMTSYDAPHSPVAYDTAKLSSFLYSLTELPYEPLPDSLSSWYQASPDEFPPLLAMRIEGVHNSFAYRIAQLPLKRNGGTTSATGASSYDAQYAVLLVDGMEPKLISLSQWDAAMPHLWDLQPR